MNADIQTFEEHESLAALMDFFTRDAGTLVVAVADGRPTGFVTCNSLVALSRPVKNGTLAAELRYADTSDYLLVPDLRPLEAEQPA